MPDLAGYLLVLAVLGLVVERGTELVHSSKFFMPLRNLVAKIAYPIDSPPLGEFKLSYMLSPWGTRNVAMFFNSVLSCGYCASVWVAMPVAAVCPTLGLLATHGVVDWVIKVVVLHGLANWMHELYQWADQSYVVAQPPFEVNATVRQLFDDPIDADGAHDV